MKLSIYFWGIIGFFSIVIVILIWKHFSKGSHYQEKCTVDDDCSKGYKCIFSRDINHNICVPSNDKECNISKDSTQLQSCDPTDSNSCNMCINQPEFSCVPVSWGKVKLTNGGSGYVDGNFPTTTTGTGTGMEVIIKTLDGVVQDNVSISNPGNNYKENDIITISSADNKATLQFLGNQNPYNWKQGDNIINVPESLANKGWCLPDVKQQTTSCNQFTSDTILVENEDKKYEWGCHCTIQNLFDQSNPSENCNVEKACGYESGLGELYVIKNPDTGNNWQCTKTEDCSQAGADSLCCVVDTTGTGSGNCGDDVSGEQKYCHVPWLSQQDSEPRYGRCKCDSGLTYYGYSNDDVYTKDCVTDSCQPYGIKSGDTCICNVGYINCPEDIPDSGLKTNCTSNPRCIPDPCAPLGQYDKSSKTCNCNGIDTSGINFDSSSPTGERCIDLCANNGPCGERGTCRVTGTGANKVASCTCSCPWCNYGDPGCPANPNPSKTDTVCSGNTRKGKRSEPCYGDDECCPPLHCTGGILSDNTCN